MKKGYVEIPEGQVHYLTDGSGPPVLLLHQTPLSSDEFADVVPILARKYWVIAMDTLGHGNSDLPPREYEIADFADSVINFLDVMGISRASLVGHHTGASIAADLTARYPQRVDKLVLSGCPAMDAREWEEFWTNIRKQIPAPPPIADDGAFILRIWRTYRGWTPGTSPEICLRPLATSVLQATRPYDAHRAVDRHDIKTLLPLITSPTLLIGSSRDVLFDLLERSQRLIPKSKTKVIEDAGALVCLEKPQEFAQAVLDFLEGPSG